MCMCEGFVGLVLNLCLDRAAEAIISYKFPFRAVVKERAWPEIVCSGLCAIFNIFFNDERNYHKINL